MALVALVFLLLGRALAAPSRDLAEMPMRLAEEATLAAERTRERDQAQAALRELRAEADAHRAELATLRETLAQERRRAAEQLAQAQQTREAMTREFRLLSDEMLLRHGTNFARANIEQIDLTLKPLREKLTEFQQSLQTAHKDSGIERAVLAEQIRHLSDTSAKMSLETQSLTQALKGRSQTQGAWGEMILATILEKSGLREGEEYRTQVSHTNDEGERLRPDVIVFLPHEQSIVIDAKVSLTAYAAAVAAETEAERAAHRRAHVQSLRQHVRTLAGKEYHKHAAGTLDYVVMFVPIEGALALALTEAPDLTGFAVENDVYLATPTTLMIALRTAANVWQVERRNRNAEQIADRAGRIYDKVLQFVGSMDRLGRALGGAQEQYDRAMGQLSRGGGNVLRQVETLKQLGARTTKSLPAELLDEEEALAEVQDAD